MTAYGRASLTSQIGRLSVEIQSVNRKHLEINIVCPGRLNKYDAEIKKWISAAVARGQINIRINVVNQETSPVSVAPNLPLARQVFAAWNEIANDLNQHFELATLFAAQPDLLIYEEQSVDEEQFIAALKEVFDKALKQLTSMKMAEGKALFKDISARLQGMEPLIRFIAERAPGATERYRQKLMERVKEVAGAGEETDERVVREVCLYAEKVDIAEEVTRFQSHLVQAEQLLASDSQSVGKTLEFILQELNREINTIGAKSSDIEVSRSVITIKTELERIREQIQNVE